MTESGAGAGWQIAECLLPGLTATSAELLAGQIQAELAGRPGAGVCFLGALLMTEDEVLRVAAAVRAEGEKLRGRFGI